MTQECASIVVVNWNTRGTVLRCVEAVRRHTRVPYELILIDNGSQDGSPQALQKLEDASTKVLLLPRNLGFPLGRQPWDCSDLGRCGMPSELRHGGYPGVAREPLKLDETDRCWDGGSLHQPSQGPAAPEALVGPVPPSLPPDPGGGLSFIFLRPHLPGGTGYGRPPRRTVRPGHL